LGGLRIREERNKRRQTTGAGSTGSEPGGSARRKIDSVYEFKVNKLRNAFFHDRPHTRLMLQVVGLIAMEPPIGGDDDAIRDEIVKVFKSI